MTRLGIREVEAGIRTQSESDHWIHWRYRSSHDETEPRKATYARAGKWITITPDYVGDKPPPIL